MKPAGDHLDSSPRSPCSWLPGSRLECSWFQRLDKEEPDWELDIQSLASLWTPTRPRVIPELLALGSITQMTSAPLFWKSTAQLLGLTPRI